MLVRDTSCDEFGHPNLSELVADEFGHPNLSELVTGTSCGQYGPNFPAVPFWYSGNFGFQIRPQLGTDLLKVPHTSCKTANITSGSMEQQCAHQSLLYMENLEQIALSGKPSSLVETIYG